jgi:negative regulator of sigma-B (phosphoserine phosphatase)
MFDIEIAQRSLTGQPVCGDFALVINKDTGVLVAVADGLGHGMLAHQAAEAFCSYAKEHAREDIKDIIIGSGQVMAKTRGAAGLLMDLDTKDGLVTVAGIGNIELRARAKERVAPVNMPGILGRPLRKVKRFEYALNNNDLFVIFSDGISVRFDIDEYQNLPVREIAKNILNKHGKSHDDATCVVVRVLNIGG